MFPLFKSTDGRLLTLTKVLHAALLVQMSAPASAAVQLAENAAAAVHSYGHLANGPFQPPTAAELLFNNKGCDP